VEDETDIWSPDKIKLFRGEFLDFLSHCYINSKDGGVACLGKNVYGSQTRMLDSIFDGLADGVHDFKYLKSRQLGCSTFARAFALFWLGVHDGLRGALVLDDDKNKEAARREIESMIRNLPDHIKFPRIKISNRYGIILDNDSALYFFSAGTKKGKASGGGLGRSTGLNFAICSEMCRWADPLVVDSFKPTLSKTFPNRLYIWESPLALDTPLLTPNGWTTIGAVEVGDFVFDENGQPTEVVGLSPIFEGHRCFEIAFDTGEKIISDAAHKWQVERMGSSCSRWSTKVVTTEQLDPARDRIWLGDPVEGIDRELPLHPYFLGAWLGDGHNEAVRLTCGENDMQEMRDNLKRRGVEIGPVTKFKGRGGGVFGIHGLMPLFRELNLINNKHIPEEYLRATVDDRLELLRGLMDTDGSIVKQGHCQFTNSCVPLISGFCELLSSLGIRYHINWVHHGNKIFPNGKSYECKSYAMVGFMPPDGMDIFSLKRKLDRQIAGSKRRPRRNRVARILSIKEVSSVPVKCISVDTPTHLFKVGRTLIPTHNTALGPNLWQDMWEEAQADDLTQRAVFLGWWSRNDQRLKKGSPLYNKYAAEPLTERELERIAKVKELYDVDIDMEQVAWFRQQVDPSKALEDDEQEDPSKTQEQPWTEFEAFQITGSQFFSPTKLTQVMSTQVSADFQSYKFYYGTDFFHTRIEKARSLRETQLKIWQEPVSDATYVITADPAFGHNPENNNSAIQVLRCYADCVEQVAEFADAETPTDQFAFVIAALCAYYGVGPNFTYKNTIELIIEINGPGEAVLNAFKALKNVVEAPHMRTEATDRGVKNIFQNVRSYIYQRSDSYTQGNSLQWKTTPQLKEAIFYRLRDFVNSDTLIIRSQAVLLEMQSIIRDGETIGAPGMKRDDRTFALAMGIRAWEDRLRRRMLQEGYTRQRDEEKRKVSPADKFQIFNRNQIESMFVRNRIARLNQMRQQRYRSWHR
jgi:hypothetical protein